MADGQEQIQEQQPDNSQQELAQQMAFALGTQQPEQPIEAAPPSDTPIVSEPAPFSFDTLKTEFQYEKPEDVITEIKELRALKAAPPAPAPIVYENEESKKLHQALLAGKKDEVYKILEEQQKLERFTTQEINRETAADIIKLGMQLKYKDLTPAEIEYKFNKQYALPKQPIYNDSIESEEDYNAKLEVWKEQVADVEMNKIIEAKLARPELEAAKSKIVLPELESAAPDEGYANYQKMIAEAAESEARTKEAYKTITPNDIVTKFNFNDEASKVNFDFEYKPNDVQFKQSVEIASDNEKFFNTFLNPDGSPNRQLWIDAVHFALHKKDILTNAINQGSNARIKSQLPDNGEGGLVRHLPQDMQPNELDMAMQAAGIKVGG